MWSIDNPPPIGTVAALVFDKLTVYVTVKANREAYGRCDALVVPVKGTGEQWVSAERLQPIES